MNMKSVFKENPILAIMRNIPLEKTLDYADTIIKGGINCFEVALNSPAAYQQIYMLKETFGDRILIGAGTAITVEKAEKALDAGAEFLLTPSVDEEILKFCKSNDILLLPGVLTPSDVALCLKYEFSTMKLFPAADMPENYIRSLKGPFDTTEYVAIGGVNEENIVHFFKQGFLAAGLSGNIMPKRVLERNEWEDGVQYIRNLVKKVREEAACI